MNISKKRNFPENEYEVYKLSKKERGNFVNVWFPGAPFYNKNTKKYIPQNEFWTLKKVDKETSRHLYSREWNSVSISIFNSLAYVRKETIHPFNMKVQIHSIDDSSFSIWINEKSLTELEEIRTNIMKYVDSKVVLNGEEFLNYCESIGGSSTDKDYD